MLAQPPPEKEKPGAGHAGLKSKFCNTNLTSCKAPAPNGQGLCQRRAQNVIKFCIRHAALLDKPDVKALAGIVNGFEPPVMA